MPKSHRGRNAANGLNGRFSFVLEAIGRASGLPEKPQKWL
jgi:hypothetical protein